MHITKHTILHVNGSLPGNWRNCDWGHSWLASSERWFDESCSSSVSFRFRSSSDWPSNLTGMQRRWDLCARPPDRPPANRRRWPIDGGAIGRSVRSASVLNWSLGRQQCGSDANQFSHRFSESSPGRLESFSDSLLHWIWLRAGRRAQCRQEDRYLVAPLTELKSVSN